LTPFLVHGASALRLLVRPETVLRWQQDMVRRRWRQKSQLNRPGRPDIHRDIRSLVLRFAKANPGWGYRRIHGELAGLGIKLAPWTVWEILQCAWIGPAPRRAGPTWADFLWS
jgi:putative transposase